MNAYFFWCRLTEINDRKSFVLRDLWQSMGVHRYAFYALTTAFGCAAWGSVQIFKMEDGRGRRGILRVNWAAGEMATRDECRA
jgi:hypothetical protein